MSDENSSLLKEGYDFLVSIKEHIFLFLILLLFIACVALSGVWWALQYASPDIITMSVVLTFVCGGICTATFTKSLEEHNFFSFHTAKQVFIVMASVWTTHLILATIVMAKYGQTEKPIVELDGIPLGQHIEVDDLSDKLMDNTVTVSVFEDAREWDFKVQYNNSTDDDYQTTVHKTTYIAQDERGVYKVKTEFSNLVHHTGLEMRELLLDEAKKQYGGSVSYREHDLFDGKHALDVNYKEVLNDEKHSASVTIYIAKNRVLQDTETERESLMMQQSAMDLFSQPE